MDDKALSSKVEVLSALADRTRLSLVKKIAEGPLQGSGCASLQSCFALSQPAMSHHFKILLQAGIINQKKQGRQKYYEIDYQVLESSGIKLNQLIE